MPGMVALAEGMCVQDNADVRLVRGWVATLRARREALKLTQADVGAQLGISGGAVGAIERGESFPTLLNFVGYVRVVRLPFTTLLPQDPGAPLGCLVAALVSESSEMHEVLLAFLRLSTSQARRARPSGPQG